MGQALRTVRRYSAAATARLHTGVLDALLGMLHALSAAAENLQASADGQRPCVVALASVSVPAPDARRCRVVLLRIPELRRPALHSLLGVQRCTRATRGVGAKARPLPRCT
jgi:hypothetical protein